MFKREKIKSLVTIEDVSNASSRQLERYFKNDEKHNFMRIKSLDDTAREFLRRKITRHQSHFNIASLLSLVIAFIALGLAIINLDLSKIEINIKWLPTLEELKILFLIYVAALSLVPIMIIKTMLDYINLEMLINKYELKELKKY